MSCEISVVMIIGVHSVYIFLLLSTKYHKKYLNVVLAEVSKKPSIDDLLKQAVQESRYSIIHLEIQQGVISNFSILILNI